MELFMELLIKLTVSVSSYSYFVNAIHLDICLKSMYRLIDNLFLLNLNNVRHLIDRNCIHGIYRNVDPYLIYSSLSSR